ncbi:MAG: YggT family protein [Xanthomonadales bacterium]
MNASGSNALTFLITTLVDLYVTAVLLRLLLQWVRADFYNPVCQFLVRITNPVLAPLRRVIPSIGRIDTASIVLMLGLEVIATWIVVQFGPVDFGVPQIVVYSVVKLLGTLLWTWFFLIIAMVILSWVGRGARHPVIPLVYQLTEPLLRPVRRVIPPIAGIDLAPLFVLVAIRFLLILLGF